MQKQILNENTSSNQAGSTDLGEAIQRIYADYGSDLPAFFRDAYKEATLKCDETENRQR